MNNKLAFGLGTLLGGVVGAYAAHLYLDSKYEKRFIHEVDSMMEHNVRSKIKKEPPWVEQYDEFKEEAAEKEQVEEIVEKERYSSSHEGYDYSRPSKDWGPIDDIFADDGGEWLTPPLGPTDEDLATDPKELADQIMERENLNTFETTYDESGNIVVGERFMTSLERQAEMKQQLMSEWETDEEMDELAAYANNLAIQANHIATKAIGPYVISQEEFSEEHFEYDKMSLTYYAQDGVLCDDQDMLIPDDGAIVGPDALDRFGDMSMDENIVYVRNDAISSDIEVLRVEGGYGEYVLGITPDDDGSI